jgi:hypothetical protein
MGTSNLAARRGAKANRRKAIVVQKRKAEAVEATPGGQAARAATLPIRYCLLNENLFDVGIGTMILVRGSTVGPVVVGAFLLDSYCRGVKDVVFRTMEGNQLDSYLDMVDEAMPLVPVDPSFARKLLRDLVQWSASLGFLPPRDFTAVERLFGDVDPQNCETEFAFGQDGKPLYMSSPNERPSLFHRNLERLHDRLGPDGFDYIAESQIAVV